MKQKAATVVCTSLAMFAFAGNSVLCRMAFTQTRIDEASFTTIRLAAGALTLCAIVGLNARVRVRGGGPAHTDPGPTSAGNWLSAIALFIYASAFSFAYTHLAAATGALILFGAVQLTMVGHGMTKGVRLRGWRLAGFVIAMAGLAALSWPGASVPPLAGAAAMFAAGVAWGVYSLRGANGAADPLRETAGNFLRSVVPAAALSVATIASASVDSAGVARAVASGAAASAIGYSIWYVALPLLNVATAAVVQLTVPVITALAGLLLLDETPALRVVLSAATVLGGVAMVALGSKSGHMNAPTPPRIRA